MAREEDADAASSQRRRRRRQRHALSLRINDLRAEIQRLALERALLVSRPRALAAATVSPDDSSFLKVERLFRAFNHGYHVHDLRVPRAYVEMLTGGAALFDYYARHLELFASTRCELRALWWEPTDDSETTAVCVSAISHCVFTIGSLHAFWPAVLHDSETTQALLDHTMAKPMAFRFVFDRAGLVVDYTIEPDLHAALANGLGGDTEYARSIMSGEVRPSRPAVVTKPFMRYDEEESGESPATSSEASDTEARSIMCDEFTSSRPTTKPFIQNDDEETKDDETAASSTEASETTGYFVSL